MIMIAFNLSKKHCSSSLEFNKELEMESLEKHPQNQSLVQPLPTSEQTIQRE
jgi:hypothetical protein